MSDRGTPQAVLMGRKPDFLDSSSSSSSYSNSNSNSNSTSLFLRQFPGSLRPRQALLAAVLLLGLGCLPLPAATISVQLDFVAPVLLADGATPTTTGMAVRLGTFQGKTAAEVAGLFSLDDLAQNRTAVLSAFSIFASTGVSDDDGFIFGSLSGNLATVSPTSNSPVYVLVADNADINLATQLGVFLHTGGGVVGQQLFPQNVDGALDISAEFSPDLATAVFGSFTLSGGGAFLLGDLARGKNIISATTASFPLGVNTSFPVETNFGADDFQILAGSLPVELSLDAATGVISGTAAAADTINLTIRATNQRTAAFADQNLTLNLTAGFALTSPLEVEAVRGASFSYTLTANEAADSFSATIPGNAGWLTRVGAVLSGTPPAGQNTLEFPVSATRGATTVTQNLRITFRAPLFTPAGATTATLGTAVNITLNNPDGATGTFTATGLPFGLAISPVNGTISGTPVAADGTADVSDCGDQSVLVSLEDGAGEELASLSLTISLQTAVPVINSLGPVVGSVGNALSYPITVASPATTVSSGITVTAVADAGLTRLQSMGLSLADGMLTGVPSRAEQPFDIRIRANNSASGAPGAGLGPEVVLSIDVDAAVPAHAASSRRRVYTTVGVPFSYEYSSTNSATQVEMGGSLPPGLRTVLSVNGDSVSLLGSCSQAGVYPLTFLPKNVNRNGVLQPAPSAMPLTIEVMPSFTRPAAGQGATGVFRYPAGQPLAHFLGGNPAAGGLFFSVSRLPPGLALERAKTQLSNLNVASGTFQDGDTIFNDGNTTGAAGGGEFHPGLIWGTVPVQSRGSYPITVYTATRGGVTKTSLTLIIE